MTAFESNRTTKRIVVDRLIVARKLVNLTGERTA